MSYTIDELTHKIIGCGMEVHNILGNGFQEKIYQRCLMIEFKQQDLNFAQEMSMDIKYKNINVGRRRVDFFVEDRVMLEIKAVEQITGAHKAQAINYCEAYHIPDGLLINFGAQSLQFHRVFNRNMKKDAGFRSGR